MNTQVSIPEIKVIPKPTKTQLIEALVEREREIWKENREKVEAKIKPLREELKSECFFQMSKADKSLFVVRENHWLHDKQHVEINIRLDTPKIKKILTKIKELDRSIPSYFAEDSVKSQIKEAMKAPPKHNPLLNNKSVEKALDEILQQIKSPTKIENEIKTIDVKVVS